MLAHEVSSRLTGASVALFFQYVLSPLAVLLPLGQVVKRMHNCAFIDLEHTIVQWTYSVGMHVTVLWSYCRYWF